MWQMLLTFSINSVVPVYLHFEKRSNVCVCVCMSVREYDVQEFMSVWQHVGTDVYIGRCICMCVVRMCMCMYVMCVCI